MPIYEYQCPDCGHRFEKLQKMSDAPITVCPSCGDERVRKLVSQSAFILKGSGWYKDHYGLKKGGDGASKGNASSGSTTSSSDGGASSSGTSSSGASSSGGSSTSSSGASSSGGSTTSSGGASTSSSSAAGSSS